MKNGVLTGVLIAAVAYLYWKDYKRSKKKCGCADKAALASPGNAEPEATNTSTPSIAANLTSGDTKDVVMNMNGWGRGVTP